MPHNYFNSPPPHSWQMSSLVTQQKKHLSPERDASSAFHPKTYKPFFLLSFLSHCQSAPLLDKAVSFLVTLETVLSPLPGSGAVRLYSTLYLMLRSPSWVSLTHCSRKVEFLSVLSIHPFFSCSLYFPASLGIFSIFLCLQQSSPVPPHHLVDLCSCQSST